MANLEKILEMRKIIEENNYKFSDLQMNEIHNGMESNIDFLIYLNPKYSPEQMKLIRLGLEKKYDVNKYINLDYDNMLILYNKLSNKQEHIHNYKSEIVKEPTCKEKGIIKYTCECGDSYTEELPEKHNFTTVKILPNCQQEGYTKYRCIVCGYTYNDDFIPKTKHNYSSKIVEEPTCKKPGKILYTCISCGKTKEKEIDMIDHKYETKIIPPTCIEEGYTLNTCIMCGDSYRTDIIDKIPHAYSNWTKIKEPTCTEKGIEEQICLRCKTKNKRFLDPLGHEYNSSIIKPTCENEGYTVYTCVRCGHTYNDNYVPKIPHDFTEWEITKEPTTKEKGFRKRKCKVCNYIDEEEIPCCKLTIESAQAERIEEIKKKQSKVKKEAKRSIPKKFSPLTANYSNEDFNKYIKKFKKTPFSAKQNLLIKEGLAQGLDVKIYANPKYDEDVMYELKKGVERGIDLTKYTKNFDAQQINEIRLGIEHNIDYKKYLNKNFTSTQMREIRLGLEEGINVNKLISLDGCPSFLVSTPIGQMFQPKYSTQDMYEKRVKLNKNN